MPLLLYSTIRTVRLGDTDAAGRWFYPRWIEMAHCVFEEWLEKAGLPLARVMNMPILLPIVRCEADFTRPAVLGDTLDCSLTVVDVKEKSLTLDCSARLEGLLLARCVTTHVAVDKSTQTSVPLPEIFRLLLESNPQS